ncbi:MAG: hypothetical protein ACI81P_002766, partial [Neolewinella sp.]
MKALFLSLLSLLFFVGCSAQTNQVMVVEHSGDLKLTVD